MTDQSGAILTEFIDRSEYPLDSFQLAACQSLEEGRSVLVAAPTGSGKTTIAEFAIWLSRGTKQGRVFYTAPIKALSNQKFRELCDEYGENEVGLLTGDLNIRGSSPIVVMTTEVLRNMIYEGSSDLDNLSHVVLDEVHFLGDRFRGAVWEEIILHLPQHIKLVSLSATVSNAEEFGDWLHTVRGDTDVIVSEHRPVPLFQHVLTRGELHPLFVDRSGELAERGKLNSDLIRMEVSDDRRRSGRQGGGRAMRRSRIPRAQIAQALDQQGLLPGIVFIFSRNGCDQAVRQCLYDGVRLTTRQERDEIREIVFAEVASIPDEDLLVLGFSEWLSGLERGLAAHHAGLIPTFKSVVETLFQKRLVKIVFATETLALGINMPARSVTIEQLEKFNGQEMVTLTPGEYTQLTGRAGRRGIDTVGHAIIAWENRQQLDVIATLASQRLYPLRSTFRPTYNMTVNLLDRMSIEQARSTLELSFAQFQADREMVHLAHEIKEKQTSLDGYQKAMDRAKGSDRERWVRRHRKLKRQTDRQLKEISRRTGTIARVFDRVAVLLTDLGYLEQVSNTVKPSVWGNMLRRIYGERDLLVAESIRHNVWAGLKATELAALCCTLIYEPRRDDELDDTPIAQTALREAYKRTVEHWARLDDLEDFHHLQRKEMPHPGMAEAMLSWAYGAPIGRTLEIAELGPGDFVRVVKQTVDLLDQISKLHLFVDTTTAQGAQLRDLSDTAYDAKRLIARGIVES